MDMRKTMATHAAALAVAGLVVGCAATPVAADRPLTNDGSPQDRAVAFACSNGPDLSVRFFPAQGVAVLVRGGQTTELQQAPSGSGFVYANRTTTLRGKGDDLTVEIGRMAPLLCKAKP
ncbi:MAG: MliC family protein [Thermomonas sp.]